MKAVLIDVDNTILDFDAYVKTTMKEGFEKFGLISFRDPMFDTFTQINADLWHRLEEGTLSFEELLKIRWNMIFEALGIDFDGMYFEEYFRKALFTSAIYVEGAMDILQYLSQKYPVFVASNGPYEQQINRLRVGDLLSYFKDFFISEKVGCSKPSPEFFHHCLKVMNGSADTASLPICPDEVIMIGDSLRSDILGAQSVGIKTCYFDRSKKGLSPGISADYIISSLSQIKQIL